MENAFEYQQQWTAELERRRTLGIDLRTGHVRTEGPLDEHEKKQWDKRMARRTEVPEERSMPLPKRPARPVPQSKRRCGWRQSWPTRRQTEAAIFQYINGFYNTRRRHS